MAGGGVQVTRDIVTERSRERSRFLITRRGAKDADVLVLRLPDGQTALLIFGLEEEAGMFLWLERAEKVGTSRSSRKQTSPPCFASPALVCGGSSSPSPLGAAIKGRDAKVDVVGSRAAKALGLPWPLACEGAGIVYQFEQPFVVDSGKYARAFGED